MKSKCGLSVSRTVRCRSFLLSKCVRCRLSLLLIGWVQCRLSSLLSRWLRYLADDVDHVADHVRRGRLQLLVRVALLQTLQRNNNQKVYTHYGPNLRFFHDAMID